MGGLTQAKDTHEKVIAIFTSYGNADGSGVNYDEILSPQHDLEAIYFSWESPIRKPTILFTATCRFRSRRRSVCRRDWVRWRWRRPVVGVDKVKAVGLPRPLCVPVANSCGNAFFMFLSEDFPESALIFKIDGGAMPEQNLPHCGNPESNTSCCAQEVSCAVYHARLLLRVVGLA